MIDFKTYDNINPDVWKLFVKYAKEAKKKGFKKYSAKGIYEVIRWHAGIDTEGKYKVNNNYHADYARKMMEVYPEFRGFFTTRKLKALRKN